MSLENAPDEVKLAVDLIMLLENHDIPAETVLKALEIVKRDFEGKLPSPRPSPCGRGRKPLPRPLRAEGIWIMQE